MQKEQKEKKKHCTCAPAISTSYLFIFYGGDCFIRTYFLNYYIWRDWGYCYIITYIE